MAAAIENPNPLMPQDILSEVHKFLHGTSSKGNVNSETLTQSALFLLRTVPVARHAVLEHFFNVFDEAVHEHLLQMHIGHTVTDERTKGIETVLRDISGVLLSFIQTNPEAWAPILSSWSLELLGHVSCKYAEKRGIPHSNSLNEILQVWMTCRPTQLLMELATECFSAMVGGAPDKCVDALLEASVKYSPHFDWVVAHIGSCFPKMIINRVLNCGLKDFCSAETDPAGRDVAARMKIPKMASVVGILGHLASKHGQDIRHALMNLFEDSLQGDSNPVKVTTVPFLLQLASMSPMLLHVLTTDMIKSLTPTVLNKLHSQFATWKKTNSQEYFSLLTLVVHLAIKTDTGSYDVLHFLVTTACPRIQSDGMEVECPVKEVQDTCSELMNKLLKELQRLVHCKKRDPAACDVPLIAGLTPSIGKLVELLMEREGQSVMWLQKLLVCVALYCGQSCAASILAGVIAHAKRVPQSIVFLRLQKGIETAFPDVITVTVDHVFSLLLPHNEINHLQLLKNLLFLIQWERKTELFKKKTTSSRLRRCLQNHIKSLSSLMLHPNREVSAAVLNIIGYINIPSTLDATTLSQLCSSLSSTCFRMFEITDNMLMLRRMRLCKNCCRQIQTVPMAKSMLLQFLVEGAVVNENTLLFGGKLQFGAGNSSGQDSISLLEENRKNALSLTLSRSHSSVFHAGVIGQGLKRRPTADILPKDTVNRNIRSLLDILWICGQDIPTERSLDDTMDNGQEPLIKDLNEHAAITMATTVVNFVTPDVLYNEIFWPDEEFLRISLERDLVVWKKFEAHPFLWDMLGAFSSNAVFVHHMSPVLRCLLGTVLNHYDSVHDKAMRNSPKHFDAACQLIHSLGCSGMLPTPLSNIGEIFYYATPYEGYLLLIGVWRYIKENPLTCIKSEIEKRVCDDKFTTVITSVIHSNVHTMGHLYCRFLNTLQV